MNNVSDSDRFSKVERREERTRVRWSLRTGSRITSLIAGSLVAVAVYYLFAPTFMQTSSGLFACGAVVGSVDEFVANTCQGATGAHLAKAILSLSVAAIIGVGGVVLFGVDPVIETRDMKRSEGRDAHPSQPAGPRQSSRVSPARRDRRSSRGTDEPAARSRGSRSRQTGTENREDARGARRSRDAWQDDD